MGSASGHATDASAWPLEFVVLNFDALSTAPAGTSNLDVEPVDPNEGGLEWTALDGSVTVTQLPADYNNDSNVDAADYVVGRKFQSSTVPPYTLGDGTGDGQG